MKPYNKDEKNAGWIDGRSKGHRLGWVPNELHDRVKAQLQPGQTVTDWVIAAIKAALRKEETNNV